MFRKVDGARCQERSESESSEDADVQEREIASPTPPLRKIAAASSASDGGGLQEEFAPPVLSSSITLSNKNFVSDNLKSVLG